MINLQIDTWCTTTKLCVGASIATDIVAVTNHQWRQRKPIPGPRGLPIFGNMFQIPDDPLPALKKWKEKYGDVLKINSFGSPIVVLSGEKELHEMFIVKSTDFAGRPNMFRQRMFHPSNRTDVAFFSFSPKWLLQKKVTMNGLKMYGDRLQSLEAITHEVIQGVVGDIESLDGKPFDCSLYYYKAIADIIISVVCIVIVKYLRSKELWLILGFLNNKLYSCY